MSGWVETRVSSPGAVVDPHSIILNSGRQVDWANVPDSFKNSAGDKELPAFKAMSETAAGLLVPRSATTTLTSVVVASNVATATKTGHGFSVGEVVRIAGSNLSYANGLKTIATVPDADTFTFEATGSNATATGTITAVRRATMLLATPAFENNKSDAMTGYGCIIGGGLYENMLPDASGTPKVLSDDIKDELNATGTGFYFEQYGDTRAS
jgi:hypothetical protein